jgi:UDP-GlcNAc:undecaprenyl-phosphate/decaprenyl-phosphate GlcNAc-1-phosphate transferase
MEQAATAAASLGAEGVSGLSIFEGYVGVLMVSFLVSLCATPLMRRLAIWQGIIDRPSDTRKVHKIPVAYLGGVAVYLGIMAGVLYSLFAIKFEGLVDFHQTGWVEGEGFRWPVPISVLLGMTVIVVVGVLDDMISISPRVKIGGQLFAAAALSIDTVGVRLAEGLLIPIAKALHVPLTPLATGYETILLRIPLPSTLGADAIPIDVVYWVGTAIIGLSVVALCNASNLLDGLDGLLSGTTVISAIGLLVISLGLALTDDGPRDSQRIILCMALIGACLGFLPHNFNPATIFLGDGGSLLIGFVMCAIILTMGDRGRTQYVVAGLICFAVPIIDTALAIVRRKMEGKSISAADDQHLHHMLKRALGVKKAVFILYGIAGSFAMLGALVSLGRARMVYLLAMLLAAFIGVTAIKIARRRFIEAQALGRVEKLGRVPHELPTDLPADLPSDLVAPATIPLPQGGSSAPGGGMETAKVG